MRLKAVGAGLSDVGRQREHNEDRFAMLPEHSLYIVADGMGGHRAGDVASAIATSEIAEFFRTALSDDITWPFPFDANKSEEENKLITGIKLANRKIYDKAMQSRELHGMGTTVVAALYAPKRNQLYIAHVGDSRCYRVRSGVIDQLTRDHSLINEYLQAMPELPSDQRDNLPKNVITRALGMHDQVQVDTGTDTPQPGDLYILCSDGLSGMLTDEEIATIVINGGDDLGHSVRQLIDSANEHGGEDNVTAVLIRIADDSPAIFRPEGERISSPDTFGSENTMPG